MIMKKFFGTLTFFIALVSVFISCGSKSNTSDGEQKDSVVVEKTGPGKYCNEKYDYCFSYSDTIFTLTSENEEGAVLNSKDGMAELIIHRGNLDASVTGDINSLKLAYEADLKLRSKQEVTYKTFKSTSYILMGYENKTVFYQKTILKGGQIITASLSYDHKGKDTYHPMVDGLFKVFE